ncbi:hypothetical protein SAMN04487950_2933 [Halogranum rubrum]|uniref:Uncharacterized protein n=1 Tax=Halogranum rubrum TaxID=553466 RepID=A0A1I4FYT1_9EURY|nr:hypothetical protein [Halogranum rubrum]SFL23015.1 hypothetical protein SAMN04487950_2933 [Halogranum rubrum]
MSNLKQTGTSGIERQSDDDDPEPPQDEDSCYICYRERTDGEPCQRRINAPWVACYDHFGEQPLVQDRNQTSEEEDRGE